MRLQFGQWRGGDGATMAQRSAAPPLLPASADDTHTSAHVQATGYTRSQRELRCPPDDREPSREENRVGVLAQEHALRNGGDRQPTRSGRPADDATQDAASDAVHDARLEGPVARTPGEQPSEALRAGREPEPERSETTGARPSESARPLSQPLSKKPGEMPGERPGKKRSEEPKERQREKPSERPGGARLGKEPSAGGASKKAGGVSREAVNVNGHVVRDEGPRRAATQLRAGGSVAGNPEVTVEGDEEEEEEEEEVDVDVVVTDAGDGGATANASHASTPAAAGNALVYGTHLKVR